MKKSPCRYRSDTGEPFSGCPACGGVLVVCRHEKVWPKKRNSRLCRPDKCGFFESVPPQSGCALF